MAAPAAPDTLRRFAAIPPKGHRINLHRRHPALAKGQSLFQGRVVDAIDAPRLLVSGHNSRKIGKMIQKGKWRGFPVFTLTLEERKTCPSTCKEWRTCYGNSMNWARRISVGEQFEALLCAELAAKQRRHPAGFVVRLHILGDFYSADYVEMWRQALDVFPALHVFGYTARDPEGEIGSGILALSLERWDRFAVRFSGHGFESMGSEVVDSPADTKHIICPAQTGGTSCCSTCTLCWQSDRTIAFLRH